MELPVLVADPESAFTPGLIEFTEDPARSRADPAGTEPIRPRACPKPETIGVLVPAIRQELEMRVRDV